jgi:hypothetical protein
MKCTLAKGRSSDIRALLQVYGQNSNAFRLARNISRDKPPSIGV